MDKLSVGLFLDDNGIELKFFNEKLYFLLHSTADISGTLRRSHRVILSTARQRSFGQIMFSVTSVCQSVSQSVSQFFCLQGVPMSSLPMEIPPSFSHASSPLTIQGTSQPQSYPLPSPYRDPPHLRQADAWHSMETPSCFVQISRKR